jgi:chemotaxis protein MotB
VTRAVLVFAVASVGCVAQAQYDSALKDLERSRAEQKACDDKLAQLEEQLRSELSATKEELDELRRQRAEVDQQFADLTAKLQSLIDAGDLEVYMRRGLIMIGLPSQVLFPSGKAELTPRGQKALEKIAGVLAEMQDRRLQVVGHTDNEAIGEKLKKEFADNWELSTTRSLTVTRFLIEKGVKPDNLSAAGHGEFDPVASNKTDKGKRKNRRIELVLVPDLSGLGKAAGAKKK